MRRVLQATIIGLVVALFAIPATAEGCVNIEINHEDGQTWAGAYTGDRDTTALRAGVVGHFLWIQYGEAEGRAEYDETVSVDVSDPSIIGATVCPDGTVTLHQATPVEADKTAAAPQVVDMVEEYPETIDPADLVRPDGWTLDVYPF